MIFGIAHSEYAPLTRKVDEDNARLKNHAPSRIPSNQSAALFARQAPHFLTAVYNFNHTTEEELFPMKAFYPYKITGIVLTIMMFAQPLSACTYFFLFGNEWRGCCGQIDGVLQRSWFTPGSRPSRHVF